MAIKRLVKDACGVLEKNAVVYPRTGNIMAKYALADGIKGENGMLLAIDYENKKIVAPTDDADVIGILDCAEKEYDKNVVGLDQHYITSKEGYMPRVGILSINDRFTTSTVCYDTATYADADAIKAAIATGSVYGTYAADGVIELVADASGKKIVLKAIELTTIPNGDAAVKFAVIKA